jgi:hypothetical protein
MHNSNLTLDNEVLPQTTLEDLQKLIDDGCSSETVCSVLRLKPEVVQQFIDNDPKQAMRLVKVIKKESRKFRCTQSGRLMVSPLIVHDGTYYDESSLQEHPSLSFELVMPNPRLKAKITKFSKKSLTRLEVHLPKQNLPDDFFELIAECLSVLDFDDEIIRRVLSAVQEQSIQQLTFKLRTLLPEQRLISLIQQTTERLPKFALSLTRLSILEPKNNRAFCDAIMCLSEMLGQPATCERALEVLEEVSEKLNSQHFDWMTQALKDQPVEIRQRLELLKLRTENKTLASRLAEAEHLLHTAQEQLRRHELPVHEQTLPTFIYSFKFDTDLLHRTYLVTGEQSSHAVPQVRFNPGCCLSELPGGSLLITGGLVMMHYLAMTTVVKIDTLDEFAVSNQAPMNVGRGNHAAVYHSQYVYVLGGFMTSYYKGGFDKIGSVCERYVCAENQWEELPEMPSACQSMNAVVVEDSLFTLGGDDRKKTFKWIQRLRLDTLTWQIMELNLPVSGLFIPCFKVCDTQVFLVMDKSLYSFTPFEIIRLRALTMDEDIRSYGASYYIKRTLYCSNDQGAATRIDIGSIKLI